jgi:hypothetical protein
LVTPVLVQKRSAAFILRLLMHLLGWCNMSSAMSNRFGVDLHPDPVHWAANEHVSETVIAAVLLLHERSVEEIVPQLSPPELEKVIELVGRSPRLYPRGILEALLSAAEGQIEVKWSHTADGPSTVRANSRLCACAHARSQGRQVTGRSGAFEYGLQVARREMPCRCRYRSQSQTGTKPPAV